MKNLSKLTKVNLREIWPHEATDFTNWLAQAENLEILGDEIGIEIKFIKTEADVGKFSVDILAEEENAGADRKIIIENQLEDTNHDHLGKIITYASGYDAKIIIWIVKDAREEHKKAIEWLNEHTEGNIGFFLVKIELWQIQGSDPAPKFEIMASPNEWAKAIKTSPSNGELTDTKLQQLEFWNKFKNYVRENDAQIRLQTPRPQHCYDVSMGTSESVISLTANSRERFLSYDLYIRNNFDFYDFLKRHDGDLRDLQTDGTWWKAKKASGFRAKLPAHDIFDEEKSEEYFKWLYDKAILFQKVFGKYFKEFKK